MTDLLRLLTDEKGKPSLSRTLLAAQLAYIDYAAITQNVSAEWWALQATVIVGLIAWAAGPRGLEYIAPRITETAKTFADMAKLRLNKVDLSRKDDERDP